jgi:hypothetical protein
MKAPTQPLEGGKKECASSHTTEHTGTATPRESEMSMGTTVGTAGTKPEKQALSALLRAKEQARSIGKGGSYVDLGILFCSVLFCFVLALELRASLLLGRCSAT